MLFELVFGQGVEEASKRHTFTQDRRTSIEQRRRRSSSSSSSSGTRSGQKARPVQSQFTQIFHAKYIVVGRWDGKQTSSRKNVINK